MQQPTHIIIYKLHKDNSPVGINCYSEEEANKKLADTFGEGYKNAYIATPEQANKVFDDYGKQFSPKPLTQQERWNNWAVGK